MPAPRAVAIHIEPGGTLSVGEFDAVLVPHRLWVVDDMVTGAGHFEDSQIVERHNMHRHVVTPLSDLAKEAPEVQEAAKALWTPEYIAAYRAAVTANKEK